MHSKSIYSYKRSSCTATYFCPSTSYAHTLQAMFPLFTQAITPARLEELRNIVKNVQDKELLETLFRLDTLPNEVQLILLTQLVQEFVTPQLNQCLTLISSPLFTLRASDSIYSLSFSHDGKKIAIGGGNLLSNGLMEIWNTETYNQHPIHTYNTNQLIFSIAFNPNPELPRVAAGEFGGNVNIWDLTTNSNQPHRSFPTARNKSVFSIDYSPDGKRLATASADGLVKIWDTASAQQPIRTYNTGVTAKSVSYSADGMRLVSGSGSYGNGVVHIWDLTSDTELPIWSYYLPTRVNSVDYSPNGEWIAAGGENGYVYLWKIGSTNNTEPISYNTGDFISAVSFHPQGTQLAAGCRNGLLYVWNIPPISEAPLIFQGNIPINAIAFHPDGSKIATGSGTSLQIWRLPHPRFKELRYLRPDILLLLVILAMLHKEKPTESIQLNEKEADIFNIIPEPIRSTIANCFRIVS